MRQDLKEKRNTICKLHWSKKKMWHLSCLAGNSYRSGNTSHCYYDRRMKVGMVQLIKNNCMVAEESVTVGCMP